MRKILTLIFLFYFHFSFADNNPYAPKELKIELDQSQVSEVVRFVYIEAFKERPFMLSPELIEDKRVLSFRFNSEFSKFDSFFSKFLDELGYEIEKKNNVDYIYRKKPLEQKKEEDKKILSAVLDPDVEILTYTPKYRASNYLIQLLSPLFSGKFTQNGGYSAPDSGSFSKVDSSQQIQGGGLGNLKLANSTLIFYSNKKEVEALKFLLDKVDVRQDEVLVSAVIYEVGTESQNQSAISILGNLLKNTLSFSVGAALQADNFVKLTASGGLSTIIQLLNSDSRFTVLSNPSLRAVSGKSSTLTIGEDVPVLGAVVQSQGQAPVQSVEYRPSGLIFDLTPIVYNDVIGVKVSQELSTFTNTKTGVNNTPTLIKRKIESDIQARDGELIVLGGLKSTRDSKGRNSLPLGLTSVPLSSSSSKNSTEILILMELKKI